MRQRSFTIEQANGCVPRLALLVERLQRGALRLRDARDAVARARATGPDAVQLDEVLAGDPTLRRVVEDLDAAVAEIERLGVELKDVELGLVDFPAAIHGDPVYLCWQYGEDRVRYWHPRAEGFAGRRPLPGLPPAPARQ